MRASLVLVPLLLTLGVALYTERASARALEALEAHWGTPILPGDLVFQDLECGERCALIREATGSAHTHVGVVMVEHGERVVWEALGPVGPTPLADWVVRGRDERIAVYRPIPSLARHRAAIERAVRAMQGRAYDADYQWDDERIYCSELVAKALVRALGRDLVRPHPLALGTLEPRIRALSHGRLTSATLLVTPVDLVRSGAYARIFDELVAR